MRQCNSPGARGEIPPRGCMPTGVVFRMASKNSERKARRGITSPPTARANSFAAFSRRAQIPTMVPARASAKAAARAAPFDLEFFLQRAEHADVIRVAAVKGPIAPHHNGVHSADLCRQRVAFLQVFEDGLFVRQGDAETADAEFRNSRKKIAELADQKWEIDSINAARREARVVQQRRKRMTDGIADHAVDSRAACESVRAVEVLHLVQ